MKLTDQQLEKILLKSFDLLDKSKDACKVTISQCLQSNTSNPVLTNALVRACLETVDASDLCKMFIINRSPNIREGIHLIMAVIDVNITECQNLKSDTKCKEMVEYCIDILTETRKTVKKLYDDIN